MPSRPPKIYEDEEVVVIKRYTVDEIASTILDILRERGGAMGYGELRRVLKQYLICGNMGFKAALSKLIDMGKVSIELHKKGVRIIYVDGLAAN